MTFYPAGYVYVHSALRPMHVLCVKTHNNERELGLPMW